MRMSFRQRWGGEQVQERRVNARSKKGLAPAGPPTGSCVSPGYPFISGDMLNGEFNAVRSLCILAIIVLALSACKTTWQPPLGTGQNDRWGDSTRQRDF